MNKLDKMKKMVDGILGDDDLCEGCEYVVEGLTCAECRRKYADEIIKILRMPEVAKMVDEADTPQTDRPCDKCEWHKVYGRCIFEYCHYEYEQAHKDTPQTDCDRYVIVNDEGDKEYNCIGCTQTDCGWK